MSQATQPIRPLGLSAFVRCKNEEECIVASLKSVYRVFDEILVVLNNSTDGTKALVEDLMSDHPKIRLEFYDKECSAVGVGYYERIGNDPARGLAAYYNWCLEKTTFSHVCKWDGVMIGLPTLDAVRHNLNDYEIVMFDGFDVLGESTTNMEPRIFKYDPSRARYVDWDLYEILEHNYAVVRSVPEKCYLHMKLVKREWIHRTWVNPNSLAVRSVPHHVALQTQGNATIFGIIRRGIRWLSRQVLRTR